MRKPSLMWSIGAAAFLAGCTFSASCGSHIDGPKVEEFLKEKLKEGLGEAPTGVKCPTGEPLKKDATFMCTAGFAGGISATITLEQTDDKGFTVIKQVAGIYAATQMEKEITDGLAKQINATATADCGPRVLVAKKDGVVECHVKDKGGSTATVNVTFSDDIGTYNWKLVPPAEEKPAEEKPAEEKPADDKPAAEMPKGPEEPNVPGQ